MGTVHVLREFTSVPNDTKTVNLAAPPLGSLFSYRTVHALCTAITIEGKRRLTATHFAVCLTLGQDPIWGVWTVHGKFLRFYGRKSAVAEAYPHLVWRTKQATWSMVDVHDMDHEAKEKQLKSLYKKDKVLAGNEIAYVVTGDK